MSENHHDAGEISLGVDDTSEKDPAYLGPLIGAVMVVLILVLATLYLWGSALASASEHVIR